MLPPTPLPQSCGYGGRPHLGQRGPREAIAGRRALVCGKVRSAVVSAGQGAAAELPQALSHRNPTWEAAARRSLCGTMCDLIWRAPCLRENATGLIATSHCRLQGAQQTWAKASRALPTGRICASFGMGELVLYSEMRAFDAVGPRIGEKEKGKPKGGKEERQK